MRLKIGEWKQIRDRLAAAVAETGDPALAQDFRAFCKAALQDRDLIEWYRDSTGSTLFSTEPLTEPEWDR